MCGGPAGGDPPRRASGRFNTPPGRALDRFSESPRRRAYQGTLGRITISVRPEGGHYTYVEVATDQVGESELDKLAKRFLAEVHRLVEPTHVMRGAY